MVQMVDREKRDDFALGVEVPRELWHDGRCYDVFVVASRLLVEGEEDPLLGLMIGAMAINEAGNVGSDPRMRAEGFTATLRRLCDGDWRGMKISDQVDDRYLREVKNRLTVALEKRGVFESDYLQKLRRMHPIDLIPYLDRMSRVLGDETTQFESFAWALGTPVIESHGWNPNDARVHVVACYEGERRNGRVGEARRNGLNKMVSTKVQPRYVLVWDETTDDYAMVRYGEELTSRGVDWDRLKRTNNIPTLSLSHLMEWAKWQGETHLDVNQYVDYVMSTVHGAPAGSAYPVRV